MNQPFSLGVIVLAAGASSRMGQSKLLLPWRDTTVIGAIIRQWKQLGAAQIGVVTRVNDAALAEELDRMGHSKSDRIINPYSAGGMFSSIQCAATWTHWERALTHFAIALGDQPHLSHEMLRTLVQAAKGNQRIWQPAYGGRSCHPVLLPRLIFSDLGTSECATLKDFLAAHANVAQAVATSDPSFELDLDTPEDYRAMRERFR